MRDVVAGEYVDLCDGMLRSLEAYPDPTATGSRLWRAEVDLPLDVPRYLARHGRPDRL